MTYFLNPLTPPKFEDIAQNQITQILFRIQILTVTLFGIAIVLNLLNGFRRNPLILFGSLIFVIVTMYISHLKYTNIAAIVLLSGFLFILNYMAFVGIGIHDALVIAYPILVVLGSLLLPLPLFVLLIVLIIVSLGFLTWVELSGVITTGLGDITSPFDFVTIVMLIVLTAVIMHTVMQTLKTAIRQSQISEEALKISEARWRSFTQFSPVRILNTSREGRIEFVNIDETNPDYATIIGKSIFDYIPPEEHERLQIILEQILSEQQVIHYETKGYTVDGDLAWYDVYLGPVVENNEVTTLLFNIIDISEKKEIELQLKQSENRLRTFVSQSTEAIWMVEYDPPIPTSLPVEEQANLMFQREVVSECNQAGSEIYGFDHPKDIIGLFTKEIRGEENKVSSIINAIEFIENGYKFIAKESAQELPSGSTIFFLTNTIGIVENDCLIGTWGSERDISTIREAEQFLRKHMQELEQSNREMQQFAYVASHDLQEPLRKIQMLSSRLSSRYADILDGRGNDYLDRIQKASAKMQNLIEDLLAYSHVSTKKRPFTAVDLNNIIQTVLSDLEPRIYSEQAKIQYSELPEVNGDKTQLTQLFQNLISNAIKFHKKDRVPNVTIQGERVEEEYVITIADNGIGFEEKYSERIFTMFQRLHAKKEYEGTGVGLALCRRIVEQHNGNIEAHSQLGKGAIFTIRLPI